MINYYASLTQEEKIFLHEIVSRNKKCEMEIEFDVLSSVRQEFAVEYVAEAIRTQLNPEGADKAVVILKKILGTYVEPTDTVEIKKIKKPRKKRAVKSSKKIDSLV